MSHPQVLTKRRAEAIKEFMQFLLQSANDRQDDATTHFHRLLNYPHPQSGKPQQESPYEFWTRVRLNTTSENPPFRIVDTFLQRASSSSSSVSIDILRTLIPTNVFDYTLIYNYTTMIPITNQSRTIRQFIIDEIRRTPIMRFASFSTEHGTRILQNMILNDGHDIDTDSAMTVAFEQLVVGGDTKQESLFSKFDPLLILEYVIQFGYPKLTEAILKHIVEKYTKDFLKSQNCTTAISNGFDNLAKNAKGNSEAAKYISPMFNILERWEIVPTGIDKPRPD